MREIVDPTKVAFSGKAVLATDKTRGKAISLGSRTIVVWIPITLDDALLLDIEKEWKAANKAGNYYHWKLTVEREDIKDERHSNSLSAGTTPA